MSVRESQTFGKSLSMFEGYGGPVNVNRADLSGIDPTLDSCCQREVCLWSSVLFTYMNMFMNIFMNMFMNMSVEFKTRYTHILAS